MSKSRVLVIGSNATRIEVRSGGTAATGQYLNETVVFAMALPGAGSDVVLATPNGTKPGGQAPMQDPEMGEILRHFHARAKPTALLCHGPIATAAAIPDARDFRAALIAGDTAKAAGLAKGRPYAGYRMTVFSPTEEKVIEDNLLHDKLYFQMADASRIAGGDVSTNPVDFAPHVIEDRELITGQNPRSDHPIAAKLIQALQRAVALDKGAA